MVSAIGASIFSSSSGVGATTGGLEARLDRYKKELSDCVNCDSANTREGKQKIQDVSGKISEIKARIEANDEAKQSRRKDSPDGASISRNIEASGASSRVQGDVSALLQSAQLPSTAAGSRLDVFA